MEYRCVHCRKTYPISEARYFCDCGAALDLHFKIPKVSKATLSHRPFNHWRYKEFYPVSNRISLGEGGTHLFKSQKLGSDLNIDLYFKEEFSNPTWSFKDRGTSVEVSRALELGIKKSIVASTGNMGASVSAYCSVAGIKNHVIIPLHTSHTVRVQIGVYHPTVIELDGTYDHCASLAREANKKYGLYLFGDYAFRKEGTKSIAFEILDQLNFKPPDWIILPIGNGTLISSTWKAINEFKKAGLIRKLPSLIGLQAKGADPIASHKGNCIHPQKPHTEAHAIEVGRPTEWEAALAAIRQSKGHLLSLSDRKILLAQKDFARKEGFFIQPGSAITVAGLHHFIKQGTITPNSKVVLLLTGSGLKRPEPVHIRASYVIANDKEFHAIFQHKKN